MLDATGKKLLRLVQPDQAADVRAAALLVLGEVGLREAEVSRVVAELLDDSDPAVRLRALEAVGKLRIEQALPRLLERVSGGGPEAEAAAQAAARLGPRGIHGLQDLMHQVPPGLRRWIAGALAAGGSASAGTAAVDALLDKDPGVVDAAARSLLGEVSGLPAAARRGLADHVLDLLTSRKAPPLSAASETALLRLLAALGDERGDKVFWARLEPTRPAEVRAAALQALGAAAPPANKTAVQRLLQCATDRDFRVAAPALMMLRAAPLSERALADWLPLFDAPDPAARRFAIAKLGSTDTPAVAEALLRQLGHPDRGLHQEALAALARLESGRAALAEALRTAATLDAAWELARAQAPFAAQYAPGLRKELFAEACRHVEAGDRRADALLFLLREADARALRDQLEEKAQAHRKKKAYDKALVYLRLLMRDPACAEAIRFEAAACGLKCSDHNLAADARAADPCLQQFARLVHNPETPPAQRLEQAKWLEAEDLFYLGFHFAEANDRQEREFGGEALRLAIERGPRTKLAKDARSKLRSAGLE